MKDKCIIICNGPSVTNIINKNINYDEYDIIAVNRWTNIFSKLKIPPPTYVIVGKNSDEYNYPLMQNNSNIQFVGLANYIHFKNYNTLKFGVIKCYDKDIFFDHSLWWSGTYAIQFALQKEYKEIHIFGYTCTNDTDYNDNMIRAKIPKKCIVKIYNVFVHLKEMNVLDKLYFYEDKLTHPLRSIIF